MADFMRAISIRMMITTSNTVGAAKRRHHSRSGATMTPSSTLTEMPTSRPTGWKTRSLGELSYLVEERVVPKYVEHAFILSIMTSSQAYIPQLTV